MEHIVIGKELITDFNVVDAIISSGILAHTQDIRITSSCSGDVTHHDNKTFLPFAQRVSQLLYDKGVSGIKVSGYYGYFKPYKPETSVHNMREIRKPGEDAFLERRRDLKITFIDGQRC